MAPGKVVTSMLFQPSQADRKERIVELKPLRPVAVIVYVPVEPEVTDWDVGETVQVKSWTESSAVAVRVREPLVAVTVKE